MPTFPLAIAAPVQSRPPDQIDRRVSSLEVH